MKKTVKKIRPPAGIHPVVGECKIGDTFEVTADQAAEMIRGKEFELVDAPAASEHADATAVGMAPDEEAQRNINLN